MCIKFFHEDSRISVGPNTELSAITEYEFNLTTTVTLPAHAIIQISYPIELVLSTTAPGVCISSRGTCFVLGNPRTISISELYVTEIPISTTISFTVQFHNPDLPIKYVEVEFHVKAKNSDNTMVYQDSHIILDNITPGYYSPHILTDVISPLTSTTGTDASYIFSFTNAGYPIPIGSKIKIEFSTAWRILQPPYLNEIQNVGPNSRLSRDQITHYMTNTILGAFPNQLPKDQTISFQIGYMLTPYEAGEYGIGIYICPGGKCQYFMKSCRIQIATTPFHFASVGSSNLTTSALSNYTFDFTLGAAGMNTSHIIRFKVPDSLTDCSINTIRDVRDLAPIIPIYDLANNFYEFDVCCPFSAGAILAFSIECRNPETTRPINQFSLQAAWNSDIFYESRTLSSVEMTTLNNFQNIVITENCNEPLNNNSIEFEIIRSATSGSSDITYIQIEVIPQMNISFVTHTFLEGLNDPSMSSSTTLSKEGQKINISGIQQLATEITLRLINIRNPGSATVGINYTIEMGNGDGFQAEKRVTDVTYIECNFPCETCLSGHPNKCETCYPREHSVFTESSYIPMYLYNTADLQCLNSCAVGYYQIVSTCNICSSICKECENIDTQCTSCNTQSFLHNYNCLQECPPQYYQNEEDSLCQGNIIFAYRIYIACHETCKNCSSTFSTGCTTCYPDNYLFIDNHCGTCPLKQYFDYISRSCQCIDYIYIYIYS